jgi:CRISPR-associated protein Csx3
MTDIYNSETVNSMITALALPAILIGGPPNAGKSVLTYNLTQELRRRKIPHYVFRANPDIEGDWFLSGAQGQDNIRSINVSFMQYRCWTDEFRDFVCHDLALRRHLPLIVDLGGLPKEKDSCIFRACTHSVLLLKDGVQDKEDDKKTSQDWRNFVRANDLQPLAEITSERYGTSIITARKPIIKGTITGLERGKQHIAGPVFEAVIDRIAQLFSSYSKDELKRLHLELAYEKTHLESVVQLDEELRALEPAADEWSYDLLRPLLDEHLPAQTPMAVYGRGPNWLYAALALHAGTQPFYQFDARLGWVSVPSLSASASGKLLQEQELLHIVQLYTDDDQYVIEMHPPHNYLDYTEADQLAFPEPPSGRGVIVSGKLPLWLFTALARFYAQRDVPWIAVTDAHNNRAIIVYSCTEKRMIGDTLTMPV